jgi:hypothetical protein
MPLMMQGITEGNLNGGTLYAARWTTCLKHVVRVFLYFFRVRNAIFVLLSFCPADSQPFDVTPTEIKSLS